MNNLAKETGCIGVWFSQATYEVSNGQIVLNPHVSNVFGIVKLEDL